MRIGVDIDDTLNIVDRVRYAGDYITRNGLPFRMVTANTNMLVRMFDWTTEDVREFMHNGGVAAFTQARSRVGAAAALRRLRAAGHEIIIVTSRPVSMFTDPAGLSRAWLARHGIPYDGLVTDVEDKGLYCVQNGISVLVDDNPENCLTAQARGVYAVLALREHNKGAAKQFAHAAYSWRAIAEILFQIAEERQCEDLFGRAVGANVREAYDGWELCFGDAPADRNVVLPLTGGVLPIAEKVRECERRYVGRGQFCFRVTPSDVGLLSILAACGYRRAHTYRCYLSPVCACREERGFSVGIFDNRISVSLQEGGVRAEAYGVLHGAWFTLLRLSVSPDFKIETCLKKLTRRILSEAGKRGAVYAVMQADPEDVGQTALLQEAGFRAIYEAYAYTNAGTGGLQN